MTSSRILAVVVALCYLMLPACNTHEQKHKAMKVGVTIPDMKTITITHRYVGQIRTLRQNKIHAPQEQLLTAAPGNSTIRVDFDVPEAHYLEYMAHTNQRPEELQVELLLANGDKYAQTGKISEIDSDFSGPSGLVHFHADFPNPDGLLRHGQARTVLIDRMVKDVIAIPYWVVLHRQDRQYVYVVDKQNVAHRREIERIVVENEPGDLFVIKNVLDVDDKVVVEGQLRIHDGETVEYEIHQLKQVVAKIE